MYVNICSFILLVILYILVRVIADPDPTLGTLECTLDRTKKYHASRTVVHRQYRTAGLNGRRSLKQFYPWLLIYMTI